MSRTAYRSLPKLQTAADGLQPPERGYGVAVPSLAGVGVAAFLGALATFCLLLIIGLERSGSSTSVILWGACALTVVISFGYMGGALRMILPQRRYAFAARDRARRDYVEQQLIPFAASAYGLTEIAEPYGLLRGEPSEATLAGRKLTVILLEDGDSYGFGEYDESRLETDEEARRSADSGAPIFLFSYSMEEHSSSGDGSLHSTDDGGTYGDSGGDGGGDGGGGGGGD